MITGNWTSWQVRGGFGIKPGAFRFEERNRGISTSLPRLTPWLTRAPFGTMVGGTSAELGHATAGPLPSAAEPDPPMARVPRGLGRGDGSTAQWGRAAAGILRGPVSRPRRPGGDRRGGLAGVRGCVVGGCAGRAPTVDPGCPRVGGRRRVAERRRRAGGGAHRPRGPARGGGDRAGQPAKQGPAEGGLRGQVRRLPGAWMRRGGGRRGHDPAGGPQGRPARHAGGRSGRSGRRGVGGIVRRVVSAGPPGWRRPTPRVAGRAGAWPTPADGAAVARGGPGGAAGPGSQPLRSVRRSPHPSSRVVERNRDGALHGRDTGTCPDLVPQRCGAQSRGSGPGGSPAASSRATRPWVGPYATMTRSCEPWRKALCGPSGSVPARRRIIRIWTRFGCSSAITAWTRP